MSTNANPSSTNNPGRKTKIRERKRVSEPQPNSNQLTPTPTTQNIPADIKKKFKSIDIYLKNRTDEYKGNNKYKNTPHYEIKNIIADYEKTLNSININQNLEKLKENKESITDCLDLKDQLETKFNEKFNDISVNSTIDVPDKNNSSQTININIQELLNYQSPGNQSIIDGYKNELNRLITKYNNEKSKILIKIQGLNTNLETKIVEYFKTTMRLKLKYIKNIEKNIHEVQDKSLKILLTIQKKLKSIIEKLGNVSNNKKKNGQVISKPNVNLITTTNVNISNYNNKAIHDLFEEYQELGRLQNHIAGESELIQGMNNNLLNLNFNKDPEATKNFEKRFINIFNSYTNKIELQNSNKKYLNKLKEQFQETTRKELNIQKVSSTIEAVSVFYTSILDVRIEKAKNLLTQITQLCKNIKSLLQKLSNQKINSSLVPKKVIEDSITYVTNIMKKYKNVQTNLGAKLQECKLDETQIAQLSNNLGILQSILNNYSQKSVETYPSTSNSDNAQSIQSLESLESFKSIENTGLQQDLQSPVVEQDNESSRAGNTIRGVASVISETKKKLSNLDNSNKGRIIEYNGSRGKKQARFLGRKNNNVIHIQYNNNKPNSIHKIPKNHAMRNKNIRFVSKNNS